MIQRIQTLFFLGVVLISVLLIFVPVYELPDIQVPPNADGTPAVKAISIANNALLMLLNGAVGIFALVAVFLYRNRNLQVRIGNLMLLLLCVEVGLLFFVADTMATNLDQRLHYRYGSYLPLVSLLFTFLAVRFVKRDEALVRSADRLR